MATGDPTTAVKQLKGVADHSPHLIFAHNMHQETGAKCIQNFSSVGASGGILIFRTHNKGEISSLAELNVIFPKKTLLNWPYYNSVQAVA